jgi:uncharacterized membrane protein
MFILTLPLSNQIGVVLFLTAPTIVDWTTQSWRLRESTNRLRLITGFSEGVGISLLTIVAIPLAHKLLIILLVAGFTASLGMIGWRRQCKI